MASKEERIKLTEAIRVLGIPAHILGYDYVRDALLSAIDDSKILNSITKELYPQIAKMHSSTASRVERAIRHAIEVAYSKDPNGLMKKKFCERPTNNEFLSTIIDDIQLGLLP